jgi:branched-subunit amino acid aminotransferase/4-amino-4-deoxychorismate lyase
MSVSTARPGELLLHAVTDGGLRVLTAEAGADNVHELLERLPDGVYSALRTFRHERFLWLDAHLDRTERSMRALGWSKPLDRQRLRRCLDAAVRAYPLADARVRFDVLREPFALQGVASDMFLALSPFVPVPEEFLRLGVRVELARHLVRQSPRVKTTAFVKARKPLPLGSRERYESVLVDAEERVLECSSANIAFVRGDAVVSAGEGVLEGITSLVLRELAPTLGLRWVEKRLPLAELASVQEAFLSSSGRGLVPIVQFEETRIGDGRVGPRTRALLAAYLAFAEREARPALEPAGP